MDCILSGGLKKDFSNEWDGLTWPHIWQLWQNHFKGLWPKGFESRLSAMRTGHWRTAFYYCAAIRSLLRQTPTSSWKLPQLLITMSVVENYVFQLLKLLLLNSVTQPLSPVFLTLSGEEILCGAINICPISNPCAIVLPEHGFHSEFQKQW